MKRLLLTLAVVVVTGRDAAAQSWVNLTPVSGPAPAGRWNASAIHDTAHNRMVVFGGFSSGYHNDIWGFDLATNTWTNLTPASGPAPAPRKTPASIYDPDNHRMVTWSGQGVGAFFNDVWAFDLNTNTWSQFTPSGGPIATTVTISGTGFSTTPSQNTLTFNGVAATVTGATATQLVATVPSGATTGTIAVTTPSGSATSGSPFTVTSSSNAPTITSFTPTIGAAGTAVTIARANAPAIRAFIPESLLQAAQAATTSET